MAKKVQYRVLKTAFVNGAIVEPEPGRDVIVEAAPGLEGSALELVKAETKTAAKPKAAEEKPAAAG